MSKEAVFTMKLEPELRDAFMAEAEASHRPASQVVRELMREFIERQRQAREYDAFLRAKVDTARTQIAAGQVTSDAGVEARFAARRTALRAKGRRLRRVRVLWTRSAEQDRADIFDFIARHNPLAAIRIDEVFAAAVGRLAAPLMGRTGQHPAPAS